MCYTGIINDDDIVQQRVTGKSARDRQGQGNPLADVNRALDLFTGATFNDKVRKHTLASSAPDLMNCSKSYTRGPSKGDVASAQLLTEIIWRRCVMLGLHAPQTAVLQVVEAAAPKETSTDRTEAALNALPTDPRSKTH